MHFETNHSLKNRTNIDADEITKDFINIALR